MARRIFASPYAKNVASAQGVDLAVSLICDLIGQFGFLLSIFRREEKSFLPDMFSS